MILKKLILPILIIPLFFMGCASQDEVHCYLPQTTVSTKSPVLSGQSIVLNTPITEDKLINYLWTGPNGFQSKESNPVILNATPQMAGDYKLITTKGICKSDEITTSVSVVVNTVSCTQNNNTLTYIDYSYPKDVSLYSNSSYSFSDNEYLIYGSGYSGKISLNFYGKTKPLTGIYTIVNKSTALSSGTVHAIMDFGSNMLYYALSSNVLVYYNSVGNIIVKLCNVPFAFRTNTSTDITLSTMFTVEKWWKNRSLFCYFADKNYINYNQ